MAEMKYMPVYRDTLTAINRLSYEERGRLFTAMMAYFFEEGDPEEIATGREEVLLGLMMSRLDTNKDNARKLSETRSQARKGSSTQDEQKISNDINSNQKEQMISNDIKSQEMTPKKNKNKNKEKEEDKDKENNEISKNEPIDIYIGDIKGDSKGEKKGVLNQVVRDSDLTDQVKATLQDFIRMRKGIKKPMTDYAVKLLIGRLKKLATDEKTQVAILEQSILHSWQDVYALKDDSGGTAKSRDKPNLALEYQQRNYSDADLDKYFMQIGGSG